MESADLILLWGSNARVAHPIYFHHVLKGIRNGARLIVIDPRRSESSEFADVWLGIKVGSDIALANAICHEIITSGDANHEFVRNATGGFDAFVQHVGRFTAETVAPIVGVDAQVIKDLAKDIAAAKRVQLCWTLGITEHHSGVDNVLSLINIALLTGQVGRFGSGLVPLRGQNNVQGGGDMGALPNRLPSFGDVTDADLRKRWEALWDASIPAEPGLHLSQMFDAMAEGTLKTAWVIGENPMASEANSEHARRALESLDFLVVQDLFMTATAELADVVLPAAAGWAETEGTVTNSERRVQRVRPAVPMPEGVRSDVDVIVEVAARLGHAWVNRTPEALWNELRQVSSMHGGMSYERLERLGGLHWPCPTEDHPGTPTLHSRLWDRPVTGPKAEFSMVDWRPPHDEVTDEFPLVLTTGRRLDSYNTGVQTHQFDSPNRGGHELDMCSADAHALGVADGETVRLLSRRGEVDIPIRITESVSPGLVFTTFHFRDLVEINRLISDEWDPKSGTAEFKATAVRVEKKP